MKITKSLACSALIALSVAESINATPSLLTWACFTNIADFSGLAGTLENGDSSAVFGGVGSGIAWAGGDSFVMIPDRGPNAVAWNSDVDNTTSYISRLQNVTLDLQQTAPGVFGLIPTLNGTTLLYSSSALNYGATSTVAGDNYYWLFAVFSGWVEV